MNLVLATGLVYALLGGLLMLLSHRSIYHTATGIIAGYPRVLVTLQAKRYDARFGLAVLVCGIALQAFAAFGFSAPASEWRYPAFAAVAALILYWVVRLSVARRTTTEPPQPGTLRSIGAGLYETRRSIRLREAARVEAAGLHARERAHAPRYRSVVCLGQQWERRWWSDKLGVSADVLRDAVRHAGPMLSDIERYLITRSGEVNRPAA